MSRDPDRNYPGEPYGMQGESFGTEPQGMRGESFGPPYQPYGMQGQSFDPYGMPPGRRGVSGFAVASFIFGLIGGIPLSLIFGIVALGKIRRTGQRGRGLAIAGLVLTGAWVALFVVIFYAGALHQISQAPAPAAASYTFQAGQCFDRDQTTAAARATPLDCATPHYAEVFAVETVPGSTYPGKDAVVKLADGKCPTDGVKARTPGLNYPDVTVAFLYPQDTTWARGDRTIKCFYHRRDGQPMTGLVKDTGVPFTADQKHYLSIVGPYDQNVVAQNAAADWHAKRDLVAQSIPLVQKEIDGLKAGPWPAEAKAAADALVTAKQAELADRKKAAAEDTESGLDTDLAAAVRDSGPTQVDALRGALHLPPLH
jgi:hypothetical protein